MIEFLLLKNFGAKEKKIIFLVIILGILWRLIVWSGQSGVYLDDEIGHYLIARDAWTKPQFIFSFWGRTGCTLFYMPAAFFGFEACRVFSLLSISIASIAIAHIANKLEFKNCILPVILFELQPWVFNFSNGVLTQVPALIAITFAIYFFLDKKLNKASILIGFLPLMRHELIVLVGSFGLYLAYHRNYKSIFFLALPMLLTNMLSYLAYNIFTFSPFFRPKGTTRYGSGGILHFIEMLPTKQFVGLPISCLVILGFYPFIKSKKQALILFWGSLILITNTVIYYFGLFSSGGFGIFIMPFASILALVATKSLTEIKYLENNFIKYFAILVTVFYAYNARISRIENGQSANMRLLANEIKKRKLEDRIIASTNPWLYHYLPMPLESHDNIWFKTLWGRNRINTIKKGGIIAWDDRYSERWGHKLKLLTNKKKFRKIYLFSTKDNEAVFGLFERL